MASDSASSIAGSQPSPKQQADPDKDAVPLRSVLRVHNIQHVVLEGVDSEQTDMDLAVRALHRCGYTTSVHDSTSSGAPLAPATALPSCPTLRITRGQAHAAQDRSSGAFHLHVPGAGQGCSLALPNPGSALPVDTAPAAAVDGGWAEPAVPLSSIVAGLLWAGTRSLQSSPLPSGERHPILCPGALAFGPHCITEHKQVFLQSKHAFASVNVRPVVEGHVLVISRRPAVRMAQLTPAEVADVWSMVHAVQAGLEAHLHSDGATVVVQDGPVAGQTVPHLHVHILPRRAGDLSTSAGSQVEEGDEVYDMIRASSQRTMPSGAEVEEGGGPAVQVVAGAAGVQTGQRRVKREWKVRARGLDSMAADAAKYRAWFQAVRGAEAPPPSVDST